MRCAGLAEAGACVRFGMKRLLHASISGYELASVGQFFLRASAEMNS